MHGNVYINISTTIRNCSNKHYTNKIAWENATRQVVTRFWEPGTSTKAHNKRTADTKDYSEYPLPPRDKDNMSDVSRRGRNVIISPSREQRNDGQERRRGRNVITSPSRGQRNDGQERMSRDGTNTGNQGEEDNINSTDSSDDEPVLARHIVIENNTSTPQNSGGTTSNNRLQVALPRGNGLPTTHEMMAAWELVQQQQEHAQHNEDNYGDNNGRTNAAGKRALSYRVAKQLQKKHVNTRIQGLVKTVIFRKCKVITSKRGILHPSHGGGHQIRETSWSS